ncbi:hypothetical protein L7F22_017123 [Adiantum nelumboides]|nr:hypothetical protein [Adiantum nelumboides]
MAGHLITIQLIVFLETFLTRNLTGEKQVCFLRPVSWVCRVAPRDSPLGCSPTRASNYFSAEGFTAAEGPPLRCGAIRLFQFAYLYRASYTNKCPFYCSYSRYDDELLWAATWLFKGSSDQSYLRYIHSTLQTSRETAEFSWDNKYAGFAVLLSKIYLEGDDSLKIAKWRADNFMCLNLPGGLVYVRSGANTQYANKNYSTFDLLDFAKGQVDYILGRNPWNLSYMVGFGSSIIVSIEDKESEGSIEAPVP